MALHRAQPPANVYEGSGQLSVAIPIPGAHRDNTQVLVTPDRLRVVAECKYPQEQQNFLQHEWRVGSWELDLPLPRKVDPSLAHARLNLGVLVVAAPISDSGTGESQVTVG